MVSQSLSSVPPHPAPAGGGEIAALAGVRKAFDGRAVLEGVDLEAPPGAVTVVLGGSGSGKTTLMRILLGLESYDAGSARLFGQEVAGLSGERLRDVMMQVGMLFQFGALFDSMTVAENVGFALKEVRGLPDAEIRSQVRENLLLVGLKDVQDLYPAQLSGGMRKRVALARAIAHKPRLLLVDEPTTGLDPIMAGAISDLIVQMRDRLGVTVLAITHDINAAFHIADRIAMLYQGRVIAHGRPDEIRTADDPVVQQFVHAQPHGPVAP